MGKKKGKKGKKKEEQVDTVTKLCGEPEEYYPFPGDWEECLENIFWSSGGNEDDSWLEDE